MDQKEPQNLAEFRQRLKTLSTEIVNKMINTIEDDIKQTKDKFELDIFTKNQALSILTNEIRTRQLPDTFVEF